MLLTQLAYLSDTLLIVHNSINLGRAAVGDVFEDALEVLKAHQELLADFVTHTLPLSQAAEGFAIFEKHQARKVVLTPQSASGERSKL